MTTEQTTTKKTTTKKTSASSKAKTETLNVEAIVEAQNKSLAKLSDIDTSQMIVVKNGFQGKLVYVSSKTGEIFMWDSFGDEQEMELRELRNAKSSGKAFFINNWFMFDDDYQWVIDYLGLRQYYSNALDIENFDDLYRKSSGEIESIVGGLSVGQKRSVSYRARDLIKEGVIDSNKAISALEKALGVELVER